MEPIRNFLFLLIASITTAMLLFLWFAPHDRYYEGVISSGGFDSKQQFNVIYHDLQEVGVDFHAAVCIQLTNIDTTKKWIEFEEYPKRFFKLIAKANRFKNSGHCLGLQSGMLVLQENWEDNEPKSWEFMLLQTRSKRLMLLAGSI